MKCVNREREHAVDLPMSAVQQNQNDHFYSHQRDELYSQRGCDICCRLLKVDFELIIEKEISKTEGCSTRI